MFVAAEGRALIPNRFAAALARKSITEKLPIAWIKQLPDFSSSDGIRLFIQQLRALDERFQGDFGVRLGQIVIDTVAASFSMKSEDDNAEATKNLQFMRLIGDETSALMAPVHHYGKNPESGLRGASAWRGCADVVEGVLADIDLLSGRASNRELVCTKARDGEQGPLSPFKLEFITLRLGSRALRQLLRCPAGRKLPLRQGRWARQQGPARDAGCHRRGIRRSGKDDLVARRYGARQGRQGDRHSARI